VAQIDEGGHDVGPVRVIAWLFAGLDVREAEAAGK
jgi:hypothetical protein